MKRNISIPLIVTLISSILLPAFFPRIRLFSFAPFLAFIYTHKSFKVSLWMAALSGLFLDILSSHSFGLHTLTLTILTLFLYPQRKFFFQDNPLSLPLYTGVISFCFSLLLAFIFASKGTFFSKSFLLDLMKMSFLDMIYCIIGFVLPLNLLSSLTWKKLLRRRA